MVRQETVNGVNVATDYPGALPFLIDQRTEIRAALEALYGGSPTARALLDQGIAAGDIWLFNITGAGSAAVPSSRTAGIDLDQARQLRWMGNDGRFKLERLGGNVIHELIHAITWREDLINPNTLNPLRWPYDTVRDYNHPDFDSRDLTVRMQNNIFVEMGWGADYQQVGYDASFDVNRPLLRTDISYTQDQTIDIAYFDNASNRTSNILDDEDGKRRLVDFPIDKTTYDAWSGRC